MRLQMITLGLQIVIILCLVYNYIVTKRELKNLHIYLVDVNKNLAELTRASCLALSEKLDKLDKKYLELTHPIITVEPKKFVPKDKQLYEEELRENVNIYRG